ncbi:MAG: acetyl/propionyl/methylcrotonyl-CoA carboxylase subunit alpha [Rhodobiaceae bacterium]|jgi:propionyl-CoA carboxylase alpha chain|nr:acetyl/propionyl/methylcrotonyl-CoA carboxylase subunit alpha [Rhodobiaceae bacterium]MBT7279323.1 acetyl/propionyl/methylcrotonyl-CoA carboxylase subunit alpha [Rhodobiaceae bacterium]MDG2496268.1 acetyl/propionyl/methylcrotonyl-CoA carboxylase subunit alpha [Alphaproteobacteria bacterium]
MFKKILIANRGEIACRVIRTARAMGIQTVAVYSDADAQALHVREADEAIHIGGAPASESYLVIDKILGAIKQSGAEAVHPGYGFLSENKTFAEALDKAGVAFIGPPANAIEKMGDKITSKKLASEAGVSTVPGHMGLIADAEEAVKIANEITYPVMIKASAGGGGKGMRIAWNDDEAREGFQSSKNEAASSFGDDRIFIEKFVTQPRHIEIQVLGDKHGNVIYLGERECSIQRRNQKVIEEAPSPFLDEATRAAMGKESVALAKAVDYCSAGTVEFIVDGDKNFYFLEMNTRLQVEHPVTELITGVDLVEQMIKVAAGEKLELKQKDVQLNGWAMESRVYAEDPYRGFLPSTGRLSRYRPPAQGTQGGITVRNDTGVYEGGEISLFYDPMIAKLVTHGPDRLQAIDAMGVALDNFRIDGIRHNIDFCAAIMHHDRFRAGTITTAFIEEEYPDGFEGAPQDSARIESLAVIGFTMSHLSQMRATEGSQVLPGHQFTPEAEQAVQVGAHVFSALKTETGVTLNGVDIAVESDWLPGDLFFHGSVNGQAVSVAVDRHAEGFTLTGRGAATDVYVRRLAAQALMSYMPEKTDGTSDKELICPMPGVVVSIAVEAGDAVKAGQPLAVVEAMKMENILRAEKDTTVSKVLCAAGDKLAVDDVMIEFE